MFATVRGSNPGYKGRTRAGRFFPNDVSRRIEIVPDRDDPKTPDGTPDPDKMNQEAYALLKADPRLSVMEETDKVSGISQDVVDQLQARLREQAAELSDAKAEIVMVTDENAKLVAQVADLKEKLAKATEPTSQAGTAAAAALESTDAKADAKPKTDAKAAKA